MSGVLPGAGSDVLRKLSGMKRSSGHAGRFHRGRLGKAVRIVTLLCVFVSLWRGPVPWFHLHPVSRTGVCSETLHRHLNAWHADSATEDNQWHLHLAMLSDIIHGDGCPVPADGREEPTAAVSFALPDGSCCQEIGLMKAASALSAAAVLSSVVRASDSENLRFGAIGSSCCTAGRERLSVLCVLRC